MCRKKGLYCLEKELFMGVTPTDVEYPVSSVEIIVSKGNEQGDIVYANPIFFRISGYSQSELLDQPHSILRHPDMPKVIFQYFWSNLKSGKDVKAFVKNMTKDGGFYWVLAHVRVATNPDGSLRNYVSTRKGMSIGARAIIEPLYKKLREVEDAGGMQESLPVLKTFLQEHGGSLDTFNETMQKIQNS
jgi:PAS domain S-box-containing protein